ncbi:integrator complex subunit 2-like [Uloborus diversus]|uniref:integrator complex subunit 2-like n=1 Tax=Uloborus diversus TaxID=327109 RepID=UPI00240932B2|nr:integrator complex subunit 2-like [Uloborus diversus]
MSSKLFVLPKAFAAIQRVNTDELSQLSETELRPLLPCLVRMALCAPLDQSWEWAQKRKVILQLLSGIEVVNSLVALLSIDFHALEIDVRKEQQRFLRFGPSGGESVLISSCPNGLALEFERSDAARRLRLFLSELISVMVQVKEGFFDGLQNAELFESIVYLDEIADVLCIAQAELPGLLFIPDIAEALLHVPNGIYLLSRLVANSPDSFQEVCTTLITNGDKQDEDSPLGKTRIQALRVLCQMNMPEILSVRGKAVELCHMPGLTIILSLDYCRLEQGSYVNHDSVVGDLVAFISGLLLGSDDKVRNWFGQYFRNCQKKPEGDGNSVLHMLREELLQRLKNLVLFSIDHHNLPDAKVVQASSLLRLYCALRGIAGLKFNEEEINLLLQLLTSHPPPSPAGIRFVSLALCMLLACPSLLTTVEQEKRATDWIQWLLKEESNFGSTSGVNASFGEMLLLIAIHFHSNQITSITDLVCSTLGMKIVIRSNNLARMKNIFTQEIFTDQVVTAHAVKVPVTKNLSRNVTGFLPVHCIHQLLKSRAFTKYKVPIKDWIYKQVCCTVPPLHPVLPPLIEVYVNSVLTPSSKGSIDTTNEPISEEEILAVFSKSVFLSTEQSKNNVHSPVKESLKKEESSSLSSQLLLLYYLLLYEDTRLSNMKNILLSDRKVKRYSPQFIAQIPIFYLIQRAQKDQEQFAGLFSPLLRLLTMHYPHLCLVQPWLTDEDDIDLALNNCRVKLHKWPEKGFNHDSLDKAFEQVENCPFQLLSHLDHLLSLSVQQLWPYASKFVSYMPRLLDHSDYLQILIKAKKLWWKFNSIFPRKLWVMTVNAFPQKIYKTARKLTLDDIILDPLHVLRCDKRIFRCPPFMEIILHMLQAFLAASRTHLLHHTLEQPMLEKTGLLETEKDREDLRTALVAAQESAAVQILLECCLPTEEDQKETGLLTNLREIQSLICSHLHQVFISEPSLAKLVHFQTYSSELLPVVVSSVPSLHICLDFLPELLSQADLDKQVFAIELASHLCSQYAISKSLNIAKLCINVCNTLLGVLPSTMHNKLFLPALPALIRMCEAFPPLCEDVALLLCQLGRVCLSRICATSSVAPTTADLLLPMDEVNQLTDFKKLEVIVNKLDSDNDLCYAIQKAFVDLCYTITLDRTLY